MPSLRRFSPVRGLSPVVLAFTPALALAQEALRNAVQVDRTRESRSAAVRAPRVQDDQTRLGPVYFNAGLTYALELNDNVNISENDPESDLINRVGLDINGVWPITERNRLGVGIGVDYSIYANDSSRNRWGLNPDSELAYDFSIGEVEVTLYERFDYSKDVENEETLRGGTDDFSRFQNTIGTFASWQPGKWIYSLGYSHFNYISAGDSTDRDQDRAAEQFIGRVGYQIHPRTVAGIEATGAFTDYTQTTRESTSYSAGPYVNWQVSEFFRASVRGGYVHYNTEESGTIALLNPTNGAVIGTAPFTFEDPLDSYYAGLDLSHQLTEFISHGLTATRGIRSGVNSGSATNSGGEYVINTRLGYRISWTMTDHLSTSLRVGYDFAREPQVVPNDATPDPTDTVVRETEYGRFRVGLGLNWRASRRLSAGIRYEFTTRDSTEVDDDYTQNRLTLNLRYQF